MKLTKAQKKVDLALRRLGACIDQEASHAKLTDEDFDVLLSAFGNESPIILESDGNGNLFFAMRVDTGAYKDCVPTKKDKKRWVRESFIKA